MIFADDLVLCESTREEAEEQLDLCRNAIENNGLRVSRKKTEYLPPSSVMTTLNLVEKNSRFQSTLARPF